MALKLLKMIEMYLFYRQEGDDESRVGQVRRHASFSSRDSEKTEQQATIKRHTSSESPHKHKNDMFENVATLLSLT